VNPSWNEKLSEEELHERMLRGRKVLSELQQVLTRTYARKSVSEIARELEWSRDKVIWMQHVLGMRTGKSPNEPVKLGRWPLLEETEPS
jgi:hypothetical protein